MNVSLLKNNDVNQYVIGARLCKSTHMYAHQYLIDTKHSELRGFMWKNWLLIEFKIDENLSPHEFKVFSKRRRKFVTEEI